MEVVNPHYDGDYDAHVKDRAHLLQEARLVGVTCYRNEERGGVVYTLPKEPRPWPPPGMNPAPASWEEARRCLSLADDLYQMLLGLPDPPALRIVAGHKVWIDRVANVHLVYIDDVQRFVEISDKELAGRCIDDVVFGLLLGSK